MMNIEYKIIRISLFNGYGAVVELKNTGTGWGRSWMWRSWNGDGVGLYIFNGYGAGTEFNYFHGAVAGMNFDLRAGL